MQYNNVFTMKGISAIDLYANYIFIKEDLQTLLKTVILFNTQKTVFWNIPKIFIVRNFPRSRMLEKVGREEAKLIEFQNNEDTEDKK